MILKALRRIRARLLGRPTAVRIGPARPLGGSRPLTEAEQATVDAFHQLIYQRAPDGAQSGLNFHWLGYLSTKHPCDLIVYQEIVTETRPELIVESGTRFGGTSLFLACLLDILGGRGRVLTIDVKRAPRLPAHPRIEYITGSSLDPETIATVRRAADGKRTMVILDSLHSEDHVGAELRAYGDIVTEDCYLIVEDSNVNGHPVLPDFGPGPMEAVDGFLAATDEFVIDRDRERFLISLNPRGYLRRVESRPPGDKPHP
jgi:cephalosporin hydroxylase